MTFESHDFRVSDFRVIGFQLDSSEPKNFSACLVSEQQPRLLFVGCGNELRLEKRPF